ncbi:UMP-CMP kinase [Babesia sp. Xinjiang]|uniref:UMP-CMP kinase n=1 Tax=Babesia sp. Xinjiang TaxID=462227 RepID=UPI000A21E8AE|nr:UMP-CMP kinase [Babesia sp. Xinjiang]XP_028871398.1 UMP-CMP kinase [Babesia sp. Xinjiang]ORM40935.1 UMP-CMP kinase [Babesia sp. Xinjiang]ORM40942.1 UMP-CMP kinase [Babesia sp. Xinjiang]
MSLRQKIVSLCVDNDHVLQITIAGPPGSGKSTMSQRMVMNYGFKHVSAGECLREEMSNPNSKNQQLIRSYIDAGKVIPVEVTIELLIKKIESLGWGRDVVIVDGFPRNADNVKGWAERLSERTELIHMLALNCPIEVCRQRILGRANECERTDNASVAIDNRMKVFFDDTIPIMYCMMMAGKCTVLDASGTKEEVWNQITQALTKLGFQPKQKDS